MTKSYKRGFTLIELLVVIAIIGLLAAIVLASLGSARGKGQDTAVKGDLTNARSQAELFYNSTGANSYTGVCTASQATNGLATILSNAASSTGATAVVTGATAETATTVYCNSTASAWVAQAPLSTGTTGYWCADSTGIAKSEAAAALASATACI